MVIKVNPTVHVRNMSFSYPINSKIRWEIPKIGGKFLENSGKVEFAVLENINLQVSAGMRVALMGANGSGKTTLLKIIAGVLTPSSGEVITSGRIGNSINPTAFYRMEASLTKNIFLCARIARIPRSDVSSFELKVVSMSGLGGYQDFPLYTFSKGMIARLTFAIQFSLQLQIRVFDEWIGMGDPDMRILVKEQTQEICHNEGIFFMSSHSNTLTKSLCTHGLILKRGQQVYFGPIQEAFANYST